MRRPRVQVLALALVAVTIATGFAPDHREPSWALFDTGVAARLRGISAVSADVAWSSGSAGSVLRTTDGGATWQAVGPPDTADLQFRDIEAFDANRAVVLSVGEGEASRVYVTANGGATWTETFRNAEPPAFYDCMAFFDEQHGLALSDPVNGRFRILATSDGGHAWQVVPPDGMPPALINEFAFAASGQCLVTAERGHDDAWFATGGAAEARVFRSSDHGRTWRVAAAPIPSGPTAGIFALAFRDPQHGLAVGGDFTTPDSALDGAAVSRDGGHTWLTAATVPGEYRSGAAWVPHAGHIALAVGPTGSDVSFDRGRHWAKFDTGSLDTVDCADDGTCWASGEGGVVAKLIWSR